MAADGTAEAGKASAPVQLLRRGWSAASGGDRRGDAPRATRHRLPALPRLSRAGRQQVEGPSVALHQPRSFPAVAHWPARLSANLPLQTSFSADSTKLPICALAHPALSNAPWAKFARHVQEEAKCKQHRLCGGCHMLIPSKDQSFSPAPFLGPPQNRRPHHIRLGP